MTKLSTILKCQLYDFSLRCIGLVVRWYRRKLPLASGWGLRWFDIANLQKNKRIRCVTKHFRARNWAIFKVDTSDIFIWHNILNMLKGFVALARSSITKFQLKKLISSRQQIVIDILGDIMLLNTEIISFQILFMLWNVCFFPMDINIWQKWMKMNKLKLYGKFRL